MKTTFKDLSLPLKIGVIGGIIYLGLFTLGFAVGFIYGLA